MKWISVKEEMPSIGAVVLYTNGEYVRHGYYGHAHESYDECGFVDYASWNDGFGYDSPDDDATHWMPIPDPPKDL
jgi:hypothetical protein